MRPTAARLVALCAAPALLAAVFAAEEPKPPARPKAPARNTGRDWVQYHSREATAEGDRPRLAVTFEDGTSKDLPAAADATLLAYRPDGRFGARMPTLVVNLADTNRALVRFDPPAGKVKKAELVLTPARPGPQQTAPPLPPEPFELGVYEATDPWDETTVSWETQPAFPDRPVVSARVDAGAKELRIDVTGPLKRLADPAVPKNGWVLKVTSPLRDDGAPPGRGKATEAEVLKLFPWAESVAKAAAAAREGNKLVLAVVRAHYADETTFSEQMLVAAGLADPDVRALVLARFVPVRVRYHPGAYLTAEASGRPPADDPLAGLGVAVTDAKAPALVVATADGKAVARLTSIGTFDRDLLLRFLLDAVKQAGALDETDPWKLLAAGELDRAGKAFAGEGREARYGRARVASLRADHAAALELCQPLAQEDGAYRHEAQVQAAHALVRLGRFAEAEPLLRAAAGSTGPRAAEAGYLLGCVLHRTGEAGKAADAWRAVGKAHPRSPDAVRARARLAWPDALADSETLVRFEVPSALSRTEVDRTRAEAAAVRRGVEYLLSRQHPDGAWSAATYGEMYRVAITALAARALHRWSDRLDADLGRRARRASEAATRWLTAEVRRANPGTCNSFGAAYLVDYFVDLEESKAAVRGDVKGAVELLAGGQCPNGGWSYDLRFGTTWKGGIGGWPKTDQGRTHSVNTGQALLALARAKAAGFPVDPAALEAGKAALLKMRESAGVYTYTFPVPRSFHEKPEYSIGRGPLCEQALRRLGANEHKDLGAAIACFLEHRSALRPPVKLTEAWMSKVRTSSYFYHYAYDHAARAIVDHGEDAAGRLALLRDDLLRVVEADGSWVDFDAMGKSYGTAMALHVLYLARAANDRPK